jgi:hypothetical protein
VGALPQKAAPASPHARSVCLDLLRAKLEALDRRAPFPFSHEALCARCYAELGTLDLASELCGALARGELPAGLRDRLRAAAG